MEFLLQIVTKNVDCVNRTRWKVRVTPKVNEEDHLGETPKSFSATIKAHKSVDI